MEGWWGRWVGSIAFVSLIVVATIGFVRVENIANQANETAEQTAGFTVALHDAICRNSGILVAGLKQDIAQSRDRALFRQFFPQVPEDQLHDLIASQIARQRDQIQRLSEGC